MTHGTGKWPEEIVLRKACLGGLRLLGVYGISSAKNGWQKQKITNSDRQTDIHGQLPGFRYAL